MLTDTTKRFIEHEIEYIEAGNWRHVVTSWYLLAADLVDEYEAWNDLVLAMTVAGIDFLEKSYIARRSVIEGIIPSIIARIAKPDTTVSIKDILSEMNSLLGFNYDTLDEIIKTELEKHY